MRKSAWDITLENQGLVGSIIQKEYRWLLEKNSVLDFDDIYQIGLIGLHHAIKRFDKKKGYKLSTYAYHWIKQHITRAYRQDGFRFVRMPLHQFDKISAILKKMDKGFTFDQLCENGDVSGATLEAAKVVFMERSGVCLDAPVSEESDSTTYADFVLVHEEHNFFDLLNHADMHAIVERELKKFTPREQFVMRKRYGLDGEKWSLDRVSNILDVTKQRVAQIEKHTFDRLKRLFRINTIKFEQFV